jgi:hypothetical protein
LEGKKYLGLAFLIPFVLMTLIYAGAMDIWPFGKHSILTLDMNGQYIYYFEQFRDIFTGNGSLLYSFERAMGGEFFGIMGIIISVPLCSVIYTLLHEWILKRLREKKLCKQDATHIPADPTPLSDEEFFATEEASEDKIDGDVDSPKASKSRIKINQKLSKAPKKKKSKKSSKR